MENDAKTTGIPEAIGPWLDMASSPPTTDLYAVLCFSCGLYRTARFNINSGRWVQIIEQSKVLYYAIIHEG